MLLSGCRGLAFVATDVGLALASRTFVFLVKRFARCQAKPLLVQAAVLRVESSRVTCQIELLFVPLMLFGFACL